MLSWCSALFLRHDRALASSNLFTDIHAALCALRPHARRASISHSAKRSSAKSRRRSHSRSRSRSHSGSNNNAEAEGHGAGAGAGAASTEAASSAASAASTEASLTASTAGADAPDPLVGVISRMSSYPFSGYISRISTELMDLVTSCGGAEVDESWSLLNGESGGGKGDPEKISVFYRKLAGSGTHSFLVSGIVHAPLLNLLAMIKEVDLMPQWLGAVQSAEVLSELDGSRYRMLLRVIVKALWPVSDREAMCYGYGDVVGDSVGIYFRSVDDQGKGEIIPGAGVGGSDVQVPPVTEGCVRASVSMGGFYITPRSLATEDAPQAASCMVRGVFNVDPHLPIIPFWSDNTLTQASHVNWRKVEIVRRPQLTPLRSPLFSPSPLPGLCRLFPQVSQRDVREVLQCDPPNDARQGSPHLRRAHTRRRDGASAGRMDHGVPGQRRNGVCQETHHAGESVRRDQEEDRGDAPERRCCREKLTDVETIPPRRSIALLLPSPCIAAACNYALHCAVLLIEFAFPSN